MERGPLRDADGRLIKTGINWWFSAAEMAEEKARQETEERQRNEGKHRPKKESQEHAQSAQAATSSAAADRKMAKKEEVVVLTTDQILRRIADLLDKKKRQDRNTQLRELQDLIRRIKTPVLVIDALVTLITMQLEFRFLKVMSLSVWKTFCSSFTLFCGFHIP